MKPFCSRNSRDVRILCYHRVRSPRSYLSVEPEDFEAQIKHLAGLGYESLTLEGFFSGHAKPRSVVITFDDGYADNFEQAYPILKNYGFTASIFCITEKMNSPGFLNRSQIQAMARDGFEFGSHTLNHPHLPELDGETKKREILESGVRLKTLSGVDVRYFCYPYGQYDRESLAILRDSYYRGACSNRPGPNRPGLEKDRFLLRRTEISGYDQLEDFDLKISGAYDALHRLLHAVRGRP